MGVTASIACMGCTSSVGVCCSEADKAGEEFGVRRFGLSFPILSRCLGIACSLGRVPLRGQGEMQEGLSKDLILFCVRTTITGGARGTAVGAKALITFQSGRGYLILGQPFRSSHSSIN